ncbi:MAG: IS21 family transposase [Thermoanaerobaculia bacterium]
MAKLREAGLGARAISRKLGISRNTVRDALDPERRKKRREKDGGAKAPAPIEKLLDGFKGEIEALVRKDEELRAENPSARPLSTRLVLKALRRLGYTGGRTAIDEHLRRLRGPRRRITRAFRRFETSCGLEAQQDWTAYRVKLSGKLVTVQVFSLILCWSRQQFLRAYLDQRLPTLLWGHVSAFHQLEGVPWRIVYDRQRTIASIFIDGKPILHDEFRAFSEHYGFGVFVCESGHKERKGKIERPFRYVEEGFLPQRTFESLEDFNAQLDRWLDGGEDPGEGNRRKHGTTGEMPHERWLEEKKVLLPLPPTDRLVRHVEKRLVQKDCTIGVLGCLYTVPPRLVEEGRRDVWVSIGPEDLLVHDDRGTLVATHRLSREKGKLVIDEAHYREIDRRRKHVPRPELERKLLERFPSSAAFLEALERTVSALAPIHLKELLLLARRYRREDVEAALRKALEDGTATAGYVRKLLEREQPSALGSSLASELPRGLSLGAVDPGSSEAYGGIFEKDKQADPRKEDR